MKGAADGEPVVADGGTIVVKMVVGDMKITESIVEELGMVVEVVGSTAGKEGREQRHE